MTPEERQQSLAAARRAYYFLQIYAATQIETPEIKEDLECLLAEFKRLADKEQAQAEAGRESGHLGAEYGNLPPAPGKKQRGRPPGIKKAKKHGGKK